MFLFEWLWEVLQELRRLYEDNLGQGGPAARMQNQLRILYGRGEIDRSTFHKLRSSLQKGYSIDAELKILHRQALARPDVEKRYALTQARPEITRALDKLYRSHAILEETRVEMDRALKIIESTCTWLQAQAETTYGKAQSALPDEEAARRLLELRYDFNERIQYLHYRSRTIQQELHQVDALEADLGVYEAELILVDMQALFQERRNEDMAGIGSTLQRADTRIRDMQSRADAIEELMAQGIYPDVLEPGRDDINRELSHIGRSQAVDEELARLKNSNTPSLPDQERLSENQKQLGAGLNTAQE